MMMAITKMDPPWVRIKFVAEHLHRAYKGFVEPPDLTLLSEEQRKELCEQMSVVLTNLVKDHGVTREVRKAFNDADAINTPLEKALLAVADTLYPPRLPEERT